MSSREAQGTDNISTTAGATLPRLGEKFGPIWQTNPRCFFCWVSKKTLMGDTKHVLMEASDPTWLLLFSKSFIVHHRLLEDKKGNSFVEFSFQNKVKLTFAIGKLKDLLKALIDRQPECTSKIKLPHNIAYVEEFVLSALLAGLKL